MTDETDPEPVLLDATGLRCPLPVLRARKKLQAVAPGGLLVVRATDRAAPGVASISPDELQPWRCSWDWLPAALRVAVGPG